MRRYERLRESWLQAEIATRHGLTHAEIDRFQKKRCFALPGAFKDYLLTVNGMQEGQVDENLVCFLSLETIDQEPNVKDISPNEVEFVFAEYSMFSHWYVLRIDRDGTQRGVFVSNGDKEKRIADTFEVFLDTYLTSPSTVAYCW